MAENESMEVANEEKKEFEERILEAIKNLEIGQTTISVEGLEVSNYGEQCTVKLRGITFGIIDKEGIFNYNKENFKQIKETLKDEGVTLEDLGLPDLEQSIDQEEKENKEQEGKGNQIKTEDEGEELDEEKDDDKPELEDESGDLEKEELAKEYNVNSRQVVHFAKDKRVTEHERLQGLVQWADGYDDVYAVPGEDYYSYKFIGIKNGEREEIEDRNEQVGGKNPDVTVKRIDGEKITEVKPLSVYQVNSQEVIAMVKNEHGEPEALYCRQEGGDKKTFWGTIIPEESGKNVRQQSPEVRELIDRRNNSGTDLSKKADALSRQAALEERGLPSQQEGVQVKEIEGNYEQNRTLNIEDIAEDLMKRDGIVDRATVPPGYYENKADKVLKIMESDQNITYENAVEQVENQGEREQGGRTPGEPRDKRGE